MSKSFVKTPQFLLLTKCVQNCPSRSMAQPPDTKIVRIPQENMCCFVTDLFKKLGLDKDSSCTMSKVILTADKRGNYPHGVFSLPRYIDAICNEKVDIKAKPKVMVDKSAMALVCGANALGPIVGTFAMNLAIKKAKKTGGAVVCANMSNYYGMAGYYSHMASENCMIGMSLSNTPPLMVPFGGVCALIGANAFSFATSNACKDEFLHDIALTTLAREHIEWKGARGENLPPHVALNENSHETTDPKVALKVNRLLPFAELRGYGLGSAVEVLAGVMSGANFTHRFEKQGKQGKEENKPLDIGQFFLALDPRKFNPEYDASLNCFANDLRGIAPVCDNEPVRIPGDHSQAKLEDASCNGIPYNDTQLCLLQKLATDYNIVHLNDYI